LLLGPFEGWGRGGTTQRSNSRATPQGLAQRSKMEEVVPKIGAGETQIQNNSKESEL